jgi:hypothetical protein
MLVVAFANGNMAIPICYERRRIDALADYSR